MNQNIPKLSQELYNQALIQLQDEINDHTIYTILYQKDKFEENKKIFKKLADEEKSHYEFCKHLTNQERKPQKLLIWFIMLAVSIFGTSFVLKFMEGREVDGKSFYTHLFDSMPESKKIYEQEVNHEIELIDMIRDKKIMYAGAVVLGMNDALVELTGTLSGIALAFNKTTVIGATGFIIGIAASLSMAASAYLESKESDYKEVKPLTYSLYTGITYVITTLILICPFFIFESKFYALALMFIFALAIIFSYNFYISIAKGVSFWKRVSQMCSITFGVAIISFGIGYGVKYFFGMDI